MSAQLLLKLVERISVRDFSLGMGGATVKVLLFLWRVSR